MGTDHLTGAAARKDEEMDEQTARCAESLARLIRLETVSGPDTSGDAKFHAFRELLKDMFPVLFEHAEYTEFTDGFVLRWQGQDPSAQPDLFMNHHDVVEAGGKWSHGPFSGEIADGRLWGRGALDDKGGLWAMLRAADELIREGYIPRRDIWFSSASTEESTGSGADEISKWFEEKGIRFHLCLDEGGFILSEPINGAKGLFALIGVGEKGCADLKFTARSGGGHASMPPKNSPLVRLGKFMAEADRQQIFEAWMNPAVCEMLRIFAPSMHGQRAEILARPELFSRVLTQALLRLSPSAAALLRTTVAFTMAGGSDGANVLPAEAWVVANMRYSHHQGQQGSFDAIRKLAEKYGLEMEVLDPGSPSRITDYTQDGYAMVSEAVKAVFPGVTPAPYLLSGASDARFFDRVSDQCLRFLPFFADSSQVASIHGIDENVNLDTLVPAVAFYKYMMKEGKS
ncbi:MAG: M20/M25/M40 family metallo-hydrolase [Clostridia bacterium]|nr:M20/M25/M40 family metallo-hydrolase [Clostridia bacterium]